MTGLTRNVYAVAGGDDRHTLLPPPQQTHRYASIISQQRSSHKNKQGSRPTRKATTKPSGPTAASEADTVNLAENIQWPGILGPEIDWITSSKTHIVVEEPVAPARVIRVPGAPSCNVGASIELKQQTHTREERVAFSKRLQRMVEKQRSNAQMPAAPIRCDTELFREIQNNINEEKPRAIMDRILEFCQPQHHQSVIQGTVAAIHECISQLPLALGRRFAGSLQELVLHDAIQQETIQIQCLQKVAQLSEVQTSSTSQVELLHSKIHELETFQDEDMEEVTVKMAELQDQLAPFLEQMNGLKRQEIMEQSAISRNLAEFNKLQGFCGSVVDERAHQRVQEQLINMGTSKWRSSREVQVPLEQQIAKIQTQVDSHQQQKLEVEHAQTQRAELLQQLKSDVTHAIAEQTTITAELEKHQKEWHGVQTVALRMQEVVGATKRIKTHLTQVESYIYGAGGHAGARNNNIDTY